MSALIHIHEDDWGMRALHPAECWDEITADVAKAASHGAQHRAPDGFGWTSMHVLRPPSLDFSSKQIFIDLLARQLSELMPRVSRFYATASAGFDPTKRDPYGSYDEDAWAFGFDATCFVKLEAKGDVLGGVWFQASTQEPAQLEALCAAILAIDEAAPCLIVDYWAEAAGLVRDEAFMTRYFAWLAAV